MHATLFQKLFNFIFFILETLRHALLCIGLKSEQDEVCGCTKRI